MAQFFKPQKKKPASNKHQIYKIERMDNHGNGIAFDGRKKPVFIAGALPKEEVIAQVYENKSKYARAHLIKVVSLHTQRITPICPDYKACGGCQLQHLAHDEQVTLKQQNLSHLLKKSQDAQMQSAPVIVSEPWAYRRRARLSLKVDKQGQLLMGFRQGKTHAITNIRTCLVLAKPLEELLTPLYDVLDTLRGRRILGHLELVLGEERPVILVRTTKMLHPEDKEKLIAFAGDQQVSLFLKQHDLALEKCVGEMPFYRIEGLKLNFSPEDFIQVNAEINQKMIAQAISWLGLDEKDHVLDLFCGLGNFSLAMAKYCASVVGIEGVKEMVERAKDNAAENALHNIEFYHADLEKNPKDQAWGKQTFNKILLDPARAGAMGAMPFIAASGAERVLYVSCDPVTLARDSQYLIEQGYRLTKMGMLDMFPQTGHLESMALFERR